ncbi:DHA2 family efflux MFS transporter permease subunit [Desulfobacula sp.]|uniref:DHA2 family efflux MFS transporter permease subunit n=1 Tax=Desulfobacula sp. TaxID=2593537 RepID=UPI0025BFDFC3|nr:DHA2 family efflux MFS transporter permease subunit [Desulfobacula sp.]MBC2703635.1 DHA2 family efflux MFS transporter permease subunit [Desulfobacula sp.]
MNQNIKTRRIYIIGAALLALFLGAMDALVMSAAMPTIVTELGGLHLYAWVYSAYFLARAVALPVFGKLCDLLNTKKLFLFSIGLFVLSSVAAGASPSMSFLIAARVFQGIGAGGVFALVYIVLSDVSLPGQRAKTLSLASSIWGISSVIGPTLGGFIVTYFSWRWIFYINVPLGVLSFIGIGVYLKEFREKRKTIYLDIAGVTFLSGFILSLLTLFITGGREFEWNSWPIMTLSFTTLIFAAGFYLAEKRAKDPILDLRFFKYKRFAYGNLAVFFSSLSIFSLFAYAPLFLQGALEQTPMQVGWAMLSLSLGWSLGSLVLGRIMGRIDAKPAALAGGLMMVTGSAMTLGFSLTTTMVQSFIVFQVVGLGMGFITLATLILVQESLPEKDLGVATSFHQFSRTLGGTIGVGICGGLATSGLLNRLEETSTLLNPQLLARLRESVESLFKPEFAVMLTQSAREILQEAVLKGVSSIFWVGCISSILGFLCCILLPGGFGQKNKKSLEV